MPNLTDVAPIKFDPLMLTPVPPSAEPITSVILVTPGTAAYVYVTVPVAVPFCVMTLTLTVPVPGGVTAIIAVPFSTE